MKVWIKVGQISYPYQYLTKNFLLEIRKATLLNFDWFWLNLITLSTLRRYQALRPLPIVLDVLLVLYKVWHIFPTILDFSYFSQPWFKEVQIVYRLFLVNCYLLHVPRLPSQPASNVGGWVIDLTGLNWLVHSDD